MAVVNVLVSTQRAVPLVLPFLETSLRDSSPNSKLQAASVLLELSKKFGWSRKMNSEASMTEGEETRWSDLIYVIIVPLFSSCRLNMWNQEKTPMKKFFY